MDEEVRGGLGWSRKASEEVRLEHRAEESTQAVSAHDLKKFLEKERVYSKALKWVSAPGH